MDEVTQGCQRLILSVKLAQSTLESVSPKEGMTRFLSSRAQYLTLGELFLNNTKA